MISEQTFVLLSGVLTFGAPLAYAISELIVLRRPRVTTAAPRRATSNHRPRPNLCPTA